MIEMFANELTDPGRLAAVRRALPLAAQRAAVFGRLARLAAQAVGVPTALITLIDADRQWWLGAAGAPEQVDAESGLTLDYVWCKHNLTGLKALLVTDGRSHTLVEHGAVRLLAGGVAYAGVPLRTARGYTIGSVCVQDVVPRIWTDADVAALHDIAALALDEIMRRTGAAGDEAPIDVPDEPDGAEPPRRADPGLMEAFRSNPVAMTITRQRDGLFADANASFERLFGYDHADLLGRTAFELQLYVVEAERAELIRQIRQTGRVRDYEIVLRTRSGALRQIQLSAEPLEYDGQPCALGTFVDITGRRMAEESLRDSEEHFRLLVEGARDYALFMVDPAGYITTWNSGAEHIKGYREAEILGQHFSCFYTAEDRARALPGQLLRQAATTGHSFDEGWRVRRDGSQFWASVIITALHDPGGRLRGFSKLTRDITEQRRAAERERRSRRALALLTHCNQIVSRATGEAELLTATCESVVTTGGYRMVWVAYAEAGEHHTVRPVARAGYDAGYIDSLQLTWDGQPSGQGPVGTALRTGQPVVTQDIANNPQFALWRDAALERGYAATIALPLHDAGSSFGSLNIYAPDAYAFDSEETSLLTELARDLAFGIALLRARATQRRAATWQAVLAEAGRIFAQAGSDAGAVVADVVRIAAELLGDTCAVRLLAADGRSLPLLAAHDRDPQKVAEARASAAEALSLDDDTPTAAVLRTGEARIVAEHDLGQLQPPLSEAQGAAPTAMRPHSQLIVPMQSQGRPLGLLILTRHRPELPAFTADDITMAQHLADRTSLVTSNARLLDQVQHELVERQRAEERLSFLSTVSSTLGQSLDYEATLARVARMCIPFLADGCNIALKDDGQMRVAAIANADRPKEAVMYEIVTQYALPYSAEHPVWDILRSGRAALVPEAIAGPVRNEHHQRLLDMVGPVGTAIVTPLMAHGETLGIVNFYRNRSSPRHTEDDLALAEEVARRAAAALFNAKLYRTVADAVETRDQVLAVVSHDLKNPLAVISGFTAVLQRRARRGQLLDAAQIADIVGKIEGNAQHMSSMLAELADTARLQAGLDLELELRSVDLRELVLQQVAHYQLTSDAHHISLESDDQALEILADAERLERVIANLLSNAIKYSPHGGRIDVRLGHEEQAGDVVLTVTDAGLGIPERDLDRIFGRFQRASNVGAIKGSGLGLASARHIAERHGGALLVESHEGIGTTFTLRLPAGGGSG